MTFTCDGDDLKWLDGVPGVAEVLHRGRRVEVRGGGAIAVRIAAALAERGLEPIDFFVERPSLEDAFLALTGHGLET